MITRMRARERWMELRRELNEAGLSRREVGKMGLLTASGVLLGADGRPALAVSGSDFPYDFPPSPPTTPFVEPLIERTPVATDPLNPPPNPAAHQYYDRFPAQRTYSFNARPLTHVFHPDLPQPSPMWGYDGLHPGPLIDARYGQPIVVRIVNSLPTVAAHRGFGIPQIITHLHNFHSASESDGGPWDWYGTGQFRDHHYTMARAGFSVPDTIPPQFRDASGGDVRETLTSLFFHDHRAEFTAANVYRGLVGFLRLFDERDTGDESDGSPQAYRLPSGRFDVPLQVIDRRFDPVTGELFFDQFETDGHLGDKYVVNGRIQPFMEVQRRKYRFRILDAGPARIFRLVFRSGGSNQPFTVIGLSGNLLPTPRNVTVVEFVPADRLDLVVDFSRFPAGARIHLANVLPMFNGRKPERGKTQSPDDPDNQIMEFRVVGGAVSDPSRVPLSFRPLPPSNLPVARRREWRFERGNGLWQINGELFDARLDHSPARLQNPRNAVRRNTNELWLLKNNAGGWEHPIHIHLEEGIVVRSAGVRVPPAQQFRADIHHLSTDRREVEVMMSFRDFPDPNFDFGARTPGEKGRYVIHCHNTSHEDGAMMQTWNVVEP